MKSPAERTRTSLIADITVGTRYRQDMGSLAALSESIEAEGLLQPVAVTEAGELVAGERRLRACRDILGWTEIPSHTVNVSSIVAGEYAENVVRKDFSTSERVSLADAIRALVGSRQGARTDLGEKEKPAGNLPEVPRRTETRAHAASLAGFGSDREYRDARDVLAKGAQELIEAVDTGAIPVSTAHELLKLDTETQAAVVKGGRLRVQEAARELRRQKSNEREKVVPRFRITEIADGVYPCTFPGCTRGADDPFSNSGRLASHRTTAHGVRSTNIADGLPAVPIKRTAKGGGKELRAQGVAARYEAGTVFHPRGAPWLDDFERELEDFPTGAHDDQVDVVSDAGDVVIEAGTAGANAGAGIRIG